MFAHVGTAADVEPYVWLNSTRSGNKIFSSAALRQTQV